ncbi:uncharacterized protein C8R40DRAFT_1040854, partial [Lentinula edodes]|uniref:uncharacterized protein n=1 Tax=Lentinula edodes TaxID=5353 RepID=UPI001E8D4BD9
CKYLAKKQLVKRHVENKHMKFNTRNKPYKCPFDGCQQAYNDTARLHQHKIDVHKYVPKPTIRCNKRSRFSSPSSLDLTTGTSQ